MYIFDILLFFLEWEMLQIEDVEEIKNTHFMFNYNFICRKSCCLWDNVEKYVTARQAIDDSMAHAHCILDT